MALLYKSVFVLVAIFQLSHSIISEWPDCSPVRSRAGVAGGIDGKTVNLNVSCEKTAAHLTWNTGGLKVSSIRLAQECVIQGSGENESMSGLSPILSVSTSKDWGEKLNVAPAQLQLEDAHQPELELECYYFGCYIADPYIHGRYYFTFNKATCTFKLTKTLETTIYRSSPSFAESAHQMSSYSSAIIYMTKSSFVKQLSGQSNYNQVMWIMIIAALLSAVTVALIISVACFLIYRKRNSQQIYIAPSQQDIQKFKEASCKEDKF